jgi:hypothetical protein
MINDDRRRGHERNKPLSKSKPGRGQAYPRNARREGSGIGTTVRQSLMDGGHTP